MQCAHGAQPSIMVQARQQQYDCRTSVRTTEKVLCWAALTCCCQLPSACWKDFITAFTPPSSAWKWRWLGQPAARRVASLRAIWRAGANLKKGGNACQPDPSNRKRQTHSIAPDTNICNLRNTHTASGVPASRLFDHRCFYCLHGAQHV